MSQDNIRRLLMRLDALWEALENDPGLSRIHAVIQKELPGLEERSASSTKFGRIFRHLSSGRYGIVSAFKTNRSEADNMDAQWALATDIRNLNLGYIPIVGKWQRVPERSILIPNIALNDLLALGIKYNQEAMIAGDQGKAELLDPKTGETLATFTKIRVVGIDKDMDNYSAVRWHLPPEEREWRKHGAKPIPVPVRAWRAEDHKGWIDAQLDALVEGSVVHLSMESPLCGMAFPAGSTFYRYFGQRDGHPIFEALAEPDEQEADLVERVGQVLRGAGKKIAIPRSWITRMFRVW